MTNQRPDVQLTVHLHTGLGTQRDPQEEVANVAQERDFLSSLLELFPCDPTLDNRLKRDGY